MHSRQSAAARTSEAHLKSASGGLREHLARYGAQHPIENEIVREKKRHPKMPLILLLRIYML
jgi:hypothetical protein